MCLEAAPTQASSLKPTASNTPGPCHKRNLGQVHRRSWLQHIPSVFRLLCLQNKCLCTSAANASVLYAFRSFRISVIPIGCSLSDANLHFRQASAGNAHVFTLSAEQSWSCSAPLSTWCARSTLHLVCLIKIYQNKDISRPSLQRHHARRLLVTVASGEASFSMWPPQLF